MSKYIKYTLILFIALLSVQSQAQSTLTITVNGTCGMCKDRIENTAKSVIGVNSADWDMAKEKLTVTVSEGMFVEDELHTALAAAGHDTDKVKATQDVYDNLHGCCKYREDDSPSVAPSDEGGDTFHIVNTPDDHADHTYSGMIYEEGTQGKLTPLIGANVYFVDTQIGTSTDDDGYFTLEQPHGMEEDRLVISYLGYVNDTIDMAGNRTVSITMQSSTILDEVKIVHKRKSTQVSFIDPIKSQKITEKELCKAACCNLSESFETTPSVDVSATDAVTGTRKISMLGLAGPYVQVTRENMPYIRGLAATNGFSFTPGVWVESIQLNMGAGSVVNGPESMTGQINVEIKKPENSEKLYLNLYANMAQRLEANMTQSFRLNDKWSTSYLAHGNYQRRFQDRNKDGFQDMPDNDQVIFMNRWKYNNGRGRFLQLGIKGTYIDKSSGQSIDNVSQSDSPWRADFLTQRIEGWVKTGKVFKDRPYASYGIQISGSYHDQQASFGARPYDGDQTSLYVNYIYQTIINSTRHKIKFGASYQYDDINEMVDFTNYERNEHLSGVFSEYQYVPNEKFTMVLGMRGDYHNNYGAFATPRIHLKYNSNETTSWRLAAGRGQRTPTIFSEHIGLFASNRSIIVDGQSEDTPYGLNAEVSYNAGINFTKEVTFDGRSAVFGIDYYYTTFDQQVVVDYDIHPQEVHFYNLDGRSYSHSIQSQLDVELIDRFDVRLAYRYNDPRTDFRSGTDVRPLVAKQRAFINLAYETASKTSLDLTGNWVDSKRLPSTMSNPEAFRLEDNSPSFFTFNGLINQKIGDKLDIYVGGENLLDFRQENAIIQFDNPYGDYFDSSLIWGPVQGRIVYVGLRYRVR